MWLLQEKTCDHVRRVKVLAVEDNFVMIRNERNRIEYVGWSVVEKLEELEE